MSAANDEIKKKNLRQGNFIDFQEIEVQITPIRTSSSLQTMRILIQFKLNLLWGKLYWKFTATP